MKLHSFVCVAGLGLVLVGCGKRVESSVVVVDECRQLVMDSIAAHGGTEKWYGNGQLQFRWKYHMSDKGPEAVVDTVQTVDPKTMAVVHEVEGTVHVDALDPGLMVSMTGRDELAPIAAEARRLIGDALADLTST